MTNYFHDFAVYSLPSHFYREPPNPTLCPCCDHQLVQSDAERSWEVRQALQEVNSIPLHYGTKRFECEYCDWWCVRERWEFLAYCPGGYADYVAAPIVQRWFVDDWLTPLENAANELNDWWRATNLLGKELYEHLPMLSAILDKYWPDNVVELITSGTTDKGIIGFYRVHTADASFLIVTQQTIQGWFSFTAVKTVNSIRYENGRAVLDISTVRQIYNPTKMKYRQKQREYHLDINPDWLDDLFPPIDANKLVTWKKMAEFHVLYENPDTVSNTLRLAFSR